MFDGNTNLTKNSKFLLKIKGLITKRAFSIKKNPQPLNSKIFISHSPSDSKIASALIYFFESLGVKSTHILSSSIPGYTILDDKFEVLRGEFINNKFLVVFILSDSYYSNPACCNEMGAVWILKNHFVSVLIPGFSEERMKGVVTKNEQIIKLDVKTEFVSVNLSTLKNIIISFFGLDEITVPRWEKIEQHFFDELRKDNNETKHIDNIINELSSCSEFTVNTIINMGYDKNTADMVINSLKNKDLLESRKFGRYSIKQNLVER